MLKKSKRGDEKYYIMISLILGVMILAISLYFIFNEYFSQDELNWEACRQSIILRSGEGSNVAKMIQSGALPFKCKTQVVTIDYKDYSKAGKEIMDAMAQCWYTFGEGKLQLYPGEAIGSECAVFDCARIHFDNSVVNFYSSVPASESAQQESETIKNLPDVKALSDELSRIELEITSLREQFSGDLVGDRNVAEKNLIDAQKEFAEKGASLSADETTSFQERISSLQKIFEVAKKKHEDFLAKLVPLDQKRMDTEKALRDLEISYLNNPRYTSTGSFPFDWRLYLLDNLDNGQTYGQYLYGWSSPGMLRDKWEGSDELKNIVYSSKFDATRGDLIVSAVYKTGAWNFKIWESPYGTVIVPHQTNQQIKCSMVETIPA